MFELGTKATRLWRSSKNEWFGGTPGFYWGCNNTKDMDVRLETIADLHEQAAIDRLVPSARDKKWLQFYSENTGKITAEAGKKAFSTPPICARHSLDAKVTTTGLVKELKTLAVFGPPIAGTWHAERAPRRTNYPEIVPLVPNDWTILHPTLRRRGETAKVADLPTKAQASCRSAHGNPRACRRPSRLARNTASQDGCGPLAHTRLRRLRANCRYGAGAARKPRRRRIDRR